MEHRNRIRALAAGVGVLVGLPAMASATTTVLSLSATSVIDDGSGVSRVLLGVGDTTVITGSLVTNAILEIELAGAEPEDHVILTLSALETAWAGRSPTWTTPWQRAGGDVSETPSHVEVLPKGRAASRLTFDVTEIMRNVADGDVAFHGFMLTVPDHRGAGITDGDLEVVASPVSAELRVTHRKIAAYGLRSSKDLTRR